MKCSEIIRRMEGNSDCGHEGKGRQECELGSLRVPSGAQRLQMEGQVEEQQFAGQSRRGNSWRSCSILGLSWIGCQSRRPTTQTGLDFENGANTRRLLHAVSVYYFYTLCVNRGLCLVVAMLYWIVCKTRISLHVCARDNKLLTIEVCKWF